MSGAMAQLCRGCSGGSFGNADCVKCGQSIYSGDGVMAQLCQSCAPMSGQADCVKCGQSMGLPRGEVTSDVWCREVLLEGCSHATALSPRVP